MKVGLLMGSFDPIHIGHVAMSVEVLNAGIVDKIFFVPTVQNPNKSISTSFALRCNMIFHAIEELKFNYISLYPIEKKLTPPYYSYKTLAKIQQEHPDWELYLIAGSDVINSIDKWNHSEEILSRVKLIGVKRNGEEFKIPVEHSIDMSLNISSTYIRKLIKDGKETFPYLCKHNRKFISRRGLYA